MRISDWSSDVCSSDLETATKSCFRVMRDRAEGGVVVLEHRFPVQLPKIKADPRAVKQILLNLLSNAVKFTDPGGRVTIHGTVDQDGALVLQVEDTGIGRSEEHTSELQSLMRTSS